MDIAAFARGYNQLLQAGNLGVGFKQAADILAPVIEVRDLIGASQRRYVRSSGISLGTGSPQTFLTVPDGSIYFVHQVGVLISAAAASSAQGAFWGHDRANDGTAITPMGRFEDLAASNQQASVEYPRLLLLPGDQLRLDGGNVAGTVNWSSGVILDLFQGTT